MYFLWSLFYLVLSTRQVLTQEIQCPRDESSTSESRGRKYVLFLQRFSHNIPVHYVQTFLQFILEVCRYGTYTGSEALLDFSLAKRLDLYTNKCNCNVYILKGKRLQFSPLFSPNYDGCGTEVWLHVDSYGNKAQIITCRGGTMIDDLRPGSNVIIELRKKYLPYDSNYCFRLAADDQVGASMMVICEEGHVISTSSTAEISTTSYFNTSRENLPLRHIDDKKWSLQDIGLVLLALMCFATSFYSVIITLKYCRSIREKPKQEEIYEEIPATLRTITNGNTSNKMTQPSKKFSKKTSIFSSLMKKKPSQTAPPLPDERREIAAYEPVFPPDQVFTARNHWNLTYSESEDAHNNQHHFLQSRNYPNF